ncbi:hypothetical protein AB205_0203490 [Aquarana catesbeiana]|uniref:Uncharacterized protein n=1 Tax=Aquarana catesbeiana TaxID=8400 RepID=A0A2G9R6N8_AQUCT|nr:hypothetical protein AB205_0203490 [Aquarana catesbeiana]
MRTFTFKILKDFGLGKKSNEWKIQEEAQCVVEEFRKCQGHPLNPSKKFMEASSNILCSILFGDRYDYTDNRFEKLLFITEEVSRITSSPWGQVNSL